MHIELFSRHFLQSGFFPSALTFFKLTHIVVPIIGLLIFAAGPMFEYTTICLISHILRGIWVASNLGLLWVKLILKILYELLYGHGFAFPLDKYLGVIC